MRTTRSTTTLFSLRSAVVGIAGVLLTIGSFLPALAGPDIDVLYISRTPRYQKYIVVEEKGLDKRDPELPKVRLAEGQEGLQRWPKKGENVTFTACIKNMGDAPTGEFNYKWYFDGKEVASDKLTSLKPGEQTTVSYKWKWDSEWNDHYIKFSADPGNLIKEARKTNNIREDRTNAFSFRLHVWQAVYDWFLTDATKVNPDIAGVEDWAQNQMGYINQMYREAVYPSTPNGILESMRLDEVVIEPNDTKAPDPGCHAPTDEYWDCRWGLTPDEYPKIFVDPKEPHPEFITGAYTWDMHEWTHQQGKIDVYQWFLGKERNHVQPYGHNVTYEDLMTSTMLTTYSEMHASVFNYDLHKRRGFFGEYQYDLPKTCKVRILDAYGNPIPNATIKFFQDSGHEVNAPEDFTGTTDAQGVFMMPNRSVKGEVAYPTGHTVHDNPWGLIHLAGFNALFFCDIKAGGQSDYQFVEVSPFNMAFRSGQTDSYTYDLRTTIVPGGRVTTNDLFGVKMISATKGYAVGAAGTILQWNGKTWSSVTSPTGQAFYSVDADASGVVSAVGGGGMVVVCSDGKWVSKKLNEGANLTACAVVSPTTIIVGGERGQLFRSTDKGDTWTRIDGVNQNIKSIRFANSTSGILVCEGPSAYYTKNGGVTWTKSDSDFKYSIFNGYDKPQAEIIGTLTDCSMASEKEAWACCEQGATFRSMDGGKTWKLYTEFVNFGKWDLLYAIDMKAGGSGWCSGNFNKFYNNVTIRRFADGKWSNDTVTTCGPSDCVYDISCVNGNDGWIVGKGGLILHLKGIVWPEVKPEGRPTN